MESNNYDVEDWEYKIKELGLYSELRGKNIWTHISFISLYGSLDKWDSIFRDRICDFDELKDKICGNRLYLFMDDENNDFVRVKHEGDVRKKYYVYPECSY